MRILSLKRDFTNYGEVARSSFLWLMIYLTFPTNPEESLSLSMEKANDMLKAIYMFLQSGEEEEL